MKKLAIVFDGDIVNLKGKVNAIINRISHLSEVADYRIDVYSIQFYDSFLTCKVKHNPYSHHDSNQIILEGIQVSVLWIKSHLLDTILTSKLYKKPVFRDYQLKRIAHLFSDYDAISAHSFICSNLALMINKTKHILYFCTWHGSEIHSIPLKDRFKYRRMTIILRNASCNFFVSKALAKTAKECITPEFKYKVLFNGVNGSFVRYDDITRKELRKKYGVEDRKVVSFVGNLIEVKNPQLLAPIFKQVANKYIGLVQFWIIGDGSMRSVVEKGMEEAKIDYVMWGNQPASLMPCLYQCVDVDILISKNEGLPLTLPEAISCGANAVGSKVGGIPEILSSEYVIEHSSDFVEKVSERIVSLLENPQYQSLDGVFSWENTARLENEIYLSVK